MKVLLVDDHPLVLSALQAVIQSVGHDTTVVGVDSAAGARAALRNESDYDLVLLDLALGDADGFDVLAEFRSTYPAVPVVVVSASDRTSDVIRAIDGGAMGFVPKKSSHAELQHALKLVMTGSMYVPPHMLGLPFGVGAGMGGRGAGSGAVDTVQGVMRGLGDGGGDSASMPLGAGARAEPHQKVPSMKDIGLTPRQAEVLSLLLQGLPNKLIARQLNLSVETVKDHVAAVLRALGVSTRTQAVLAVSQMTQGQGAGFSWRPPGGAGGATR
jgi:DNA-binding NarL/FixJ family response regulator